MSPLTRSSRALTWAALALAAWGAGACGETTTTADPGDSGPAAGGSGGSGGTGEPGGSGGQLVGEPDLASPTPDALSDAGPGGVDVALPDTGPTACTVAWRYDPLAGAELETFPDDFYTVDDAASPTGLRVHMADAPWRATVSRSLELVFQDLDTLDGFGVSSGVVLRFSGQVGDVPSGEVTGSDGPDAGPIGLWVLGETPRRIPFEVKVTDQGATLILSPMAPLPARARAGVVVSKALLAGDGGCVDTSPVLTSLLDASAAAPALARLAPRYAELLTAARVEPGQVLAATVFTTQSTTALSEEIVAAIQDSPREYVAPPSCRDEADTYHCEASVTLDDYRNSGDGEAIDDATPTATYEVPFSVWLPKERPAPPPVIVVGHGLGGARSNAAGLARAFCPEGFAVVAVDALGHGEHPTAPPDDSQLALLSFLGLDVATGTVHGLRIRDNLRQSAYDKAQVLRLLSLHPDLDGDATTDLDMERVVYWGVSLGGIMGSEPLATDPHYSAGILTVGGARIIDIVADAPAFAQFRPILQGLVGGPGGLDRAVPLIQTLVDPGDPVSYAPHVLRDRLPVAGARVPHLLQTMAIGDELVFNPSNRSLARALDVPVVPPVLQRVGLVAETRDAPVSANRDGVTAGLFQYDRMREDPQSDPMPASHDNAFGYEAINQMYYFLVTWRDTGTPSIIDPYAELNTPPLR